MENINVINPLDEQFKSECKVIDLKYEYSGYTGTERWAVITELTETEILEKYPEQIKPYTPFMILSPEFGKVRDDFRRNEKKHQARATRSVDAFSYDDEVMAAFHPELVEDTFEQVLFERIDAERLWRAIGQLPPIQKSRLIKRYFKGMSTRKIAREEGVNYSKIDSSISAALKNLKKILTIRGCI